MYLAPFSSVVVTRTDAGGYELQSFQGTDTVSDVGWFLFAGRTVRADELIPISTDPPLEHIGTEPRDFLSGGSGNDRIAGTVAMTRSGEVTAQTP